MKAYAIDRSTPSAPKVLVFSDLFKRAAHLNTVPRHMTKIVYPVTIGVAELMIQRGFEVVKKG